MQKLMLCSLIIILIFGFSIQCFSSQQNSKIALTSIFGNGELEKIIQTDLNAEASLINIGSILRNLQSLDPAALIYNNPDFLIALHEAGWQKFWKFFLIKSLKLDNRFANLTLNLKEFLEVAIQRKDIRLVQFLIKAGADIQAKDRYGNTLLHLACLSGDAKIARLFLQTKANTDGDGETPLHFAAKNGQLEITQMLLDDNCEDLNSKDKYGYTALHRASQEGYFEIVRLLLDNDAKVNIRNNNGATALMVVCTNGKSNKIQVARLLLAAGADVNERNSFGKSLLDFAVENQDIELAKTLLIYGARIESDLKIVQDRNFQKFIEMLKQELGDRKKLKANFNNLADIPEVLRRIYFIHYKDANGDTALHKAILDGNMEAIKAICENPNINFEIQNEAGETPLHLVLMRYTGETKGFEIAKQLIKHGAKIRENSLVKNSNGMLNRGNISQVETWQNSLQKIELLKLMKLQLLKDGKLAEWFNRPKGGLQEIIAEIQNEITETITLFIQHDVITEISESLVKNLITMNEKMYSAIDIKMFRQIKFAV